MQLEVTTAEAPAQVAAPVEEAPKESPQVQKACGDVSQFDRSYSTLW